jgi:LPS export ABC transporter protein LptC
MIMPSDSFDAPQRRSCASHGALAVLLAILALAISPAGADSEPSGATPAEQGSTELRATGMTFVGSRDDTSELVLHSRFATFYPDLDVAHLREVRAVVTDDEEGDSFEMTCDSAELNVETNDFRAEGGVRGTTADGQSYAAPWVEYDHEAGLLESDAPVEMVDATGTFRGEGFRYHVRERRFRLLGNVSAEQNR